MKKMKRIIMIMATLCLVLGLSMCKGGEQPAPVKQSDLSLSTGTITLTDLRIADMVSVKSSEDWQTDLNIIELKSGMIKPMTVGEKEWLRITPAMGKAGVVNVTISLIKAKLPASPASIDVKFTSVDGAHSKTLTVKYEPKK